MASPTLLPPRLVTGERMTRDEFLKCWEGIPDLKNAELIDGVVYVPSPLGFDHGRRSRRIISWLGEYEDETPGTECANDVTWFMLESSPQPDVYLRIVPSSGGFTTGKTRFPAGTPELIVEVCVTSREVDFGPKLALYQRAGVQEYITLETIPKRVTWRKLQDGSYVELQMDAQGIYRSEVFPGLWMDSGALWANDGRQMMKVLRDGLSSPEHAAFVERLEGKSE